MRQRCRGRVDGLDFNIWDRNYLAVGTGWSSGDFNGDAVTNTIDFGSWFNHRFRLASEARRNAEGDGSGSRPNVRSPLGGCAVVSPCFVSVTRFNNRTVRRRDCRRQLA